MSNKIESLQKRLERPNRIEVSAFLLLLLLLLLLLFGVALVCLKKGVTILT